MSMWKYILEPVLILWDCYKWKTLAVIKRFDFNWFIYYSLFWDGPSDNYNKKMILLNLGGQENYIHLVF